MAANAASAATSFQKVRSDHARETAQDYVEAVAEIAFRDGECRVKDLSQLLGVSHVTVSRVVSRLQDEGLVTTEPYRPIRLTARGQRLAAESRRRHQIVLGFLKALGVTDAAAHRDAEGIEHHVGEETLQRMAAFVGPHRGAQEQ